MKRCAFILASMVGMAGVGAMESQVASLGQVARDDQNWSLEGTVTDSVGKPLDGAQVRAEGRDGSTVMTDGVGHYVLTGTKAGRYGIFAKKDGYVRPRIRFVQLRSAMHMRLDLRVDREAALSGRMQTRDGAPIAGVQVSAWAREFRDGRPFFTFRGTAKTNDLGQYRIGNLSEGTYYVEETPRRIDVHKYSSPTPKQPRRPQFAYPALFYPGVQSFDEASPIHLRNSEEREGIDLVLERAPTFCVISSISFSNFGQRSEEAALMLTEVAKGWANIVGGGRVIPGQKYEICDLSPGVQYSLTSQLWAEGMKVLGFGERAFEGNRRDAELGHPLDLGVLSLRSAEPVSGKITIDGDQQNFPKGVLVVLESTTALPGYINETRDVQVARTGEFVLPNIFPYEHSLRILNLPPGYYLKQATCGRYDLLQDSWRPGCGEVRGVIGVDAATITGQTVDDQGKPIDGADVILVPKERSAKIAVRPVDQEGHFQFTSVIPGAYNIIALTGIPEGEAQNPAVVFNFLSHATDLNLASKGQQALTLTVLNAGQ